MIGAIGSGILRFSILTTIVQFSLLFISIRTPASILITRIRLISAINFVLVALLFFLVLYLFVTDQFEYYQVWSHSSANLSGYYKVAALWEGQEGSFLLWAFIQSFIVLVFTWKKKRINMPAAAVLLLVQLFLTIPLIRFDWEQNMVSLFSRTVDVLNLQEGSLRAAWTVGNGNGLNPLLLNFWMTIHPPFVFLSFALSSVPYALAIGGSFKDDTTWLEQSNKWLKVSLALLTLGILMGAYWAYETLNFGGYWSWDPVENAVYLPWLLGLAALHVNWLATKYLKHIHLAFGLNCLYFIAVVYATFLTRSGVLSNVSVHAFVDSGHRMELILFLVVITALPLMLWLFRVKNTVTFTDQVCLQERKDWTFFTALILVLAAFQVFIYTSLPVFDSIFKRAGVTLNIAPAGDTSYTRWQGFFAILLLTALVVAEGFKKYSRNRLLILFAAVFVSLIVLTFFMNIQIAVGLSLAAIDLVLFYLVIRNCIHALLTRQFSPSMVAHAGLLFLLAGILLSSSWFGDRNENPKHYAMTYGKSISIHDEFYTYDGRFILDENDDMVRLDWVMLTGRPDRFISRQVISTPHHVYQPGDIVKTNKYDRYYHIKKTFPKKEATDFFAHVYVENNASYFITPNIEKGLFKDTYFHISNIRDDRKLVWQDSIEVDVGNNGTDGSKEVILKGYKQLSAVPGISLSGRQAFMLFLDIRVMGHYRSFAPVIITGPGLEFMCLPDFNTGITTQLWISDWKDSRDFTAKLFFAGQDWITMQSEVKPMINLFWLGGLLIVTGIIMSLRVKKSQGTIKKRKLDMPRVSDRFSKKRMYANV